jgi:hypothetical protein
MLKESLYPEMKDNYHNKSVNPTRKVYVKSYRKESNIINVVNHDTRKMNKR